MKPLLRRASWRIISRQASKTNFMVLESVAQVTWVKICFDSLLFSDWNLSLKYLWVVECDVVEVWVAVWVWVCVLCHCVVGCA